MTSSTFGRKPTTPPTDAERAAALDAAVDHLCIAINAYRADRLATQSERDTQAPCLRNVSVCATSSAALSAP